MTRIRLLALLAAVACVLAGEVGVAAGPEPAAGQDKLYRIVDGKVDKRTYNGFPSVNNYGQNRNVVIDGFLACGLADDPPMWQPNIRNTGNVVKNSKARLITAGSQENNSADMSGCAAPGPFPDITPPPMKQGE